MIGRRLRINKWHHLLNQMWVFVAFFLLLHVPADDNLNISQPKKANFDATHELEELLLEDNPLKAKKRNPNIDVSQLSADYRMMEQK